MGRVLLKNYVCIIKNNFKLLNYLHFYKILDIKLFKRRRVEHLEAVKSLQRITCYEKKYQMVILMAEKVFTVIQNSRARIEASGFVPGITEFPQDEQTKETLSSILENTALLQTAT